MTSISTAIYASRGLANHPAMRKIAPGFVATGLALLLVALLLFVYFITYRPTPKDREFEAQVDNPPSIPSNTNEQTPPRAQPLLKVNRSATAPTRHHAGPLPLQAKTPAPTPSPVVVAQNVEKKPSIFRRFLNFIKRLFGRRKKTGGGSIPPFLRGVEASSTAVVLPCREGTTSQSCEASATQKIQLTAQILNPDNNKLRYEWSVTGGRITGDGHSVSWDMSGVSPGTYTALVSVDDSTTKIEGSVVVTVSNCPDCRSSVACPSVSATSPDFVAEGHPITFVASVAGAAPGLTFNWSVSNGTITSGQGTSTLTVDSAGVGEGTITATVSLGGVEPSCTGSTASSTTAVHVQAIPHNPRKIMQYGDISFDEEKAHLDSVAVALLQNPTSKGAIIAYGKCQGDAQKRAAQAKNYLVSSRGIDSDRVVIIDGGCRDQRSTELWLVPRGAGMPESGGSVPCGECSTTAIVDENKRATLSGRVINKDGVALADATVTLIGANNFSRVVKTDSSGVFNFPDIPAGSYTLEIAAPGLGLRRIEGLEVKEGVNLLPEPIQVLEKEITTRFKLRDVIRIRYPDHFLESPAGEITFEWNRELRDTEVVTSQTNTNGRINIVDRPPPVPGGTPDVPVIEAHGRQYTAFAKVTLIADGLTVISSSSEAEQSLAPSHVVWNWKVKPANMNAAIAAFRFHIDLVWRGEGLKEQTDSYDWPATFIGKVGPPASVTAAKYGSPTFALVGLVTVGLGLRKRRLLGDPPSDARAGPPQPAHAEPEAAVAEDVSSSVFAPRRAARGEGFLVQVFAHLPGEDPATLKGKATEAEPRAERVGGDLLDEQIKRGTTLTFTLSMAGLQIDQPQQSRVWRGRTMGVQFGVTVPPDFKPGSMFGMIVVSADTIPIGHFRFAFEVVDPGGFQAETPSYIGALTRYQHAFISYAHEDRAEVLKRVQMLSLLKEKFFQDFISLEPGKPWEPAIREAIDRSDVIFLFWSKAASASTEVKKEILYAVARRSGDDNAAPAIVPVIIEGPPPPAPPTDLKFLHFDDKFSYWIFAAKAGAQHEAGE